MDNQQSQRKRPNKKAIIKQGKLRGHLTANEELMLKGLEVKNLLQRINNRAFDDIIKPKECKLISDEIDKFVASVGQFLKPM